MSRGRSPGAERLARLGRGALKRGFSWWERRGVHVTPVHFYAPVPDTRSLPDALWRDPGELPGVDLRVDAQLELLGELAAHRDSFSGFPRAPGVPGRYHVDNGSFEAGDGDALHAILRHLRPRRMVEVGSGFSTLLAAETLAAQDGTGPSLTVIDPHPTLAIRGVAGVTRLLERPVQRLPLETFADLGAGDVLFIDSSHVLAIGSDVQFLFLEVLPRLAPGVVIHVHDVFLPSEYPREWVMREHRFWTEQYLLQAFLAFNAEFEVLLSLAYLHQRHPDAMEAAFGAYRRDRNAPGSFWMRRRPEPATRR
ncbi:MAG: class I SAM-dependent methyltransferase [Actinobacteria bacterium]|nr:class I SAM-dependent methyltransferase [Actinomycetota bacterium]